MRNGRAGFFISSMKDLPYTIVRELKGKPIVCKRVLSDNEDTSNKTEALSDEIRFD